MPVQVSYPGVYVQEAPSGVISISGVSTSVAAFVGMCPSGPVNVPTRVLAYRDFENRFGGDVDVGELPLQVRQFFMNGGGQAWIVRTARNATDGSALVAKSTIHNETGNPVLVLAATDAGAPGNLLRVEVDYDTASPERSFNLTVYREVYESGEVKKVDPENFTELSMRPDSPNYAPTVIKGSRLITAKADTAIPAEDGHNVSASGLIFDRAMANAVAAAFDQQVAAGRTSFTIIAGGRQAAITLAPSGTDAALIGQIVAQANGQLAGITTISAVVENLTGSATGDRFVIRSDTTPIEIVSASKNDLTQQLQLGVANNGLEYDGWSHLRPAPTGYVTRLHNAANGFDRLERFVSAPKNQFQNWDIAGTRTLSGNTGTADVANLIGEDGTLGITGATGSFAQAKVALEALATAIELADVDDDFAVDVHGYRLVITARFGGHESDRELMFTTAPGPYDFESVGGLGDSTRDPNNVARYALGQPLPPAPSASIQTGDYRSANQVGANGETPLVADYTYSYDKLERAEGPFNILILPRAKGDTTTQSDSDRDTLWGAASAFCEKQRAFLIVDPHGSTGAAPWTDAEAAVTGAKDMRSGVVTDHAAIYWPRVKTMDAKGKDTIIDPAGTMAGLYAKTDNDRGVWKAPAGLGASLIGIRGLEYVVTNEENGLTNPEALNTLRMLSSGATSWGARTMIGFPGAPDQDYKYIPVRRLALYIAGSLEIGLGFAVFEPNGETLWGQIRMAAGAFMNGLFRDGAFKGEKAGEAYYVACGPDTTTQTDINLGIVNVEVGFAPLKPAEFVVITIRQIVGQIDT